MLLTKPLCRWAGMELCDDWLSVLWRHVTAAFREGGGAGRGGQGGGGGSGLAVDVRHIALCLEVPPVSLRYTDMWV
jgi:hypothetical protein